MTATVSISDSKVAAGVVAMIASKKTFAVGIAMYCDLVNDGTFDREREVRCAKKQKQTSFAASAECRLIRFGLLRREDSPSHIAALAVASAVAAVKLSDIEPLCGEKDRPYRTEVAKMARKLFTRLGIKGVSFTTPVYSMASGVNVRFPEREDYDLDREDALRRDCEAGASNRRTREKIESILLRAFPGTHDKSDRMSDYFNCYWHIG